MNISIIFYLFDNGGYILKLVLYDFMRAKVMSDVVHVTKLVDYLEVIFDFKDFEST